MSAPFDIEIYDSRLCRTWCLLSKDHFDFFNKHNMYALGVAVSGSLDAPDQLPAGSVRDYGRSMPFVRQVIIGRDNFEYSKDIALREEIADQIINEILLENKI